MTDSPTNQPQGVGSEPPLYAPESGASLFVKLFIVPAGIVAVALGIFLLGTLALQHPKTAKQYLQELKSDSTSKRWQSAFELSRMLSQGEKIQFDENLRGQLVQTFVEAKKDDPRVREYLALVLGNLKEKSAVPALSEAVHDESDDVKIYSLWALGNIEDPAGGPAALEGMSDSSLEVERMAVGAVSALKYGPARSALEKNLTSESKGLRYDSAVALARLKDNNAIPTLMDMLNLKAQGAPDDEIIQSAKLAAIEGAGELNDPSLRAKIAVLAKDDPDVKVQDAAIKAGKK